MMMHVMFMDVNLRDKRSDHDCNVVHEIVRVNISLVSCPPHVAPRVTTAMYVYLSARGDNRPHLMSRRGSRPQIEIRSRVGDSRI